MYSFFFGSFKPAKMTPYFSALFRGQGGMKRKDVVLLPPPPLGGVGGGYFIVVSYTVSGSPFPKSMSR